MSHKEFASTNYIRRVVIVSIISCLFSTLSLTCRILAEEEPGSCAPGFQAGWDAAPPPKDHPIILQANQPPFPLRAPWPNGQWWQPSTYSGHTTQGVEYAIDFNRYAGPLAQCPLAQGWMDDTGEAILAAHSGTVQVLRQTCGDPDGCFPYNPASGNLLCGYGQYVRIVSDQDDRYSTLYGHLQDGSTVANGTYVREGDVIGRCGSTGCSTGPHLHFELRFNNQLTNMYGLVLSDQAINIQNCSGSLKGRAIEARASCTPAAVAWSWTPAAERYYREDATLTYSVGGTGPNQDGTCLTLSCQGLGRHRFWRRAWNGCGDVTIEWYGGWDNQPPSASITGGAAPGVWHKGNVSTVYTGSDAHSGFKDSRWWIESGPSGGWAGDNPRTVNIPSDSGIWRLWTEVADQAWTGSTQLGNSAQIFLGEFKVDNTVPNVSMPTVASNCLNADTVEVSLSGSDAHSGISKVHLLVNGQQVGSISISSGAYNWRTVGLADGTYQIAARAEDAVGNLSAPSSVVSITLDRTPPAIEESVTASMCPGGWYNGPVTLSFAATDTLCGVATTSAMLGSQPVVAPFTITDEGQHTVVLTATDNAGNVALKTIQINIDLTAPSAPVINDGDISGSLKTLAASWAADDTLSGIWDFECSVYTVETGQQVEVVPPTRTGGVPHFWKTNLMLKANQEYFIQVSAIDRACNQTSEVSTGVTIIPGIQDEGQTFAAGGVSTGGRSSGGYVLYDTFAEPIVGDTGGAGFSEVYAGYWTPELDIATVAALAGVWSLPDGKTVVFGAPLVVTAGTSDFAGRFWVQQPNRAQGMRVDVVSGSPVVASRNAVVTLSGKLATKGGERILEYPSVSVSGSADPVQPVYIPNHMLGGQAMSAMQPGVWQGEGLLNVGLLVKSTGWMYPIDSQRFLIIDGQGSYGASAQGVLVMLDNLASGKTIVPPLAGYVVVTGISSVAEVDGKYVRCIRPRSQSDIEVVF